MTDNIATLGLKVDSSQVTGANSALDALVAAAKQATDAMNDLAAAGNAAGEGAKKLRPGLDDGTESLRGQRNALRGLSTDLALLSPAFGGLTQTAAALYIENAHLIEGFGGLRNAIGALL